MSTAGGGFKVGISAWVLQANARGVGSLSFLKQRASTRSRDAENVWMNFFFPPLAGPLSSNPTWVPNWVPLQVALQMPAIKRLQPGYANQTARANINWFTTLATNEASGNQVWAKFRAGTKRVVVQLKMVPGYYQPLALNLD